jgi:hypothetical protein
MWPVVPPAIVVVPTVIVPADADMVQVPPRAQFWPLTVVTEFAKAAFGTASYVTVFVPVTTGTVLVEGLEP